MICKRILVLVTVLFIATEALAQSFTMEDLLAVFPLSTKAKAAFRIKVRIERLSQNQARALFWQLIAEGETLMSEKDKQEMTNFFLKAIETLTPAEQMFVTQVSMKVSQGYGYSDADQQKSSALVQKGFSKLSDKDNNRYLQLRAKALELALLKPQEAQQQFKSTYPPPASSGVHYMTPEQKQKRIQELKAKAISLLPEKDRLRFLELHLTPADQLTKAQYAERLKYSEKIITLLSESEMNEIVDLSTELLENQ